MLDDEKTLTEIKSRIFKGSDGWSNYTSVSIEEMDWLVAQVEKQQKEIVELTNLNLWSARRLPMIHKEFAYKKLIEISGEAHEKT